MSHTLRATPAKFTLGEVLLFLARFVCLARLLSLMEELILYSGPSKNNNKIIAAECRQQQPHK